MKIAMTATGGVGGYYGARLAGRVRASVLLRVVLTSRHCGLMASNCAARMAICTFHLCRRPMIRRRLARPNIVIFAVKQYDTEAAAKLIVPLLGDQTAVISIQNGIDPQERLKTIVGREHVMGGTTYITGANVIAPGIIAHTGSIARLVFVSSTAASARAARAFSVLARKPVSTGISPAISPTTCGQNSHCCPPLAA